MKLDQYLSSERETEADKLIQPFLKRILSDDFELLDYFMEDINDTIEVVIHTMELLEFSNYTIEFTHPSMTFSVPLINNMYYDKMPEGFKIYFNSAALIGLHYFPSKDCDIEIMEEVAIDDIGERIISCKTAIPVCPDAISFLRAVISGSFDKISSTEIFLKNLLNFTREETEIVSLVHNDKNSEPFKHMASFSCSRQTSNECHVFTVITYINYLSDNKIIEIHFGGLEGGGWMKNDGNDSLCYAMSSTDFNDFCEMNFNQIADL